LPRGLPDRATEVYARLTRDRRAIEKALAAALGSDETRIERAARHGLLGGGKRVRPLLSCAVLRAFGQNPAPFIDRLIAVEIAHAGSLLHDDIIDESTTRRGRLAAHIEFDVPTAVLAGDRLVMLGVEQVANGGPRELVVCFCSAVNDLCVGESLEREHRFDTKVTFDDVRRVNRLKTASLFAYAAEAGAILAGASPRERRAARNYGTAVGEAFQTTDDLLDLRGDPKTMGKPIGQDLLEGVVTIPVAIALTRSPDLRHDLQNVWKSKDNGEREAAISRFRDRVDETGAFDATIRLASDDAARAADAIMALPRGAWRDRLATLAAAIVNRKR
jgi:octaprenyl-diphosphate synthase